MVLFSFVLEVMQLELLLSFIIIYYHLLLLLLLLLDQQMPLPKDQHVARSRVF